MKRNMIFKTISTCLFLLVLAAVCQAQSNTFPSSGPAGIGVTNPTAPLEIHANGTASYPSVTSRGDVFEYLEANNNSLEFGLAKGLNSRKAWILTRHSSIEMYGQYYGTLHLQPKLGDMSSYRGVAIGFPADMNVGLQVGLVVNGNVGIGTSNPQADLSVNGNILAKEVKIKTDISVPDYVFEPDYELPALSDVKAYVTMHKHLPEIPSAVEIQRDGLDVAEMNLQLLKKVEELTLYLLQQQETIVDQQKQIDELKGNHDKLIN